MGGDLPRMRIVSCLSCFLTLLVLTACKSFEARPLSAEAGLADFSGRTLRDPGLAAFLAERKAGGGGWTLDRLALAAAYFHPDVALAQAEVDEAAAGVITAAMRPNPSLIVLPQWAANNIQISPWFFGPWVSIPIETAGKRFRRIDVALAGVDAARLRLADRAWQARSRVRLAMLELHGAVENLRLLKIEQTLHEEAITKLTAQLQAGAVSPFEITQARLMLNETLLALEDARRVEATSKAALAAAVGVPTSEITTAKLDFSAFNRWPAQDPRTLQRRATTARADLLALLAEYAGAEAALRLEIARQYPDVRLNPGYDYNSGQNRFQFGFNVELPLNRNRGPVAEAEARRKTAEKRFLALQAAVIGELDVARAAYATARQKVDAAAVLAREAGQAVETIRRMVEGGELSPLELTSRKIVASAANLALLSAQIEAQTTVGLLEDAAQTPL
jgi:cobalt-zinc-cadmium efflux system outer membrane protein